MTLPVGGCFVRARRASQTWAKCMTELIESKVLMEVRETRLQEVTPLFMKM